MFTSKLARYLACGMMAASAVTVAATAAAGPAGASIPRGRSCTPGEYVATTGYTSTFIPGNIQGAFLHNTTGRSYSYPAGQYSVNGNMSYTTSWSGNVGGGGSINLIIFSINGSVGGTVTKSTTKTDGWSLESQQTNPVPNGDYIIYQAGSVGIAAQGVNQWVNSSCQVTQQSSWSVHVPLAASTNFTIQNTISNLP